MTLILLITHHGVKSYGSYFPHECTAVSCSNATAKTLDSIIILGKIWHWIVSRKNQLKDNLDKNDLPRKWEKRMTSERCKQISLALLLWTYVGWHIILHKLPFRNHCKHPTGRLSACHQQQCHVLAATLICWYACDQQLLFTWNSSSLDYLDRENIIPFEMKNHQKN